MEPKMAKEKLAVVEDAPEADPILDAFTAATAAGKEGDDVKMEMIKAGAAFKSVTNLFNKFMISSGKAMSADQKKELLDKSLDDAPLDTEDGFKAAVAVVAEKGVNVNATAAASLIRAWAKKNEAECWKAPASEGTRNPFIPMFHKELVKNPEMTEDQLKGLIAGLEKDEWKVNPTRWITVHNNTRILANTIFKNLTEAA
jgi:predicted ribonuclease toxin of YeeF-YezG toxin-antitoxin module